MTRRLLGVLMVAAAAGGCQDAERMTGAPADGPRFAINDATTGGVAGFYFLPPLVAWPGPFAGTFDPGYAPVARLCALSGGACSGLDIATLTTGGGPAAIKVDAAGEKYAAVLQTKALALDPATDYRLEVYVGLLRLGYADIDVVARTQDLKSVAADMVGLVASSPLVIGFRIETAVNPFAVIGSATVPVLRPDVCGHPLGELCESLIGDVVTDAVRHTYGTEFVIMNSGGFRTYLTCPSVDSPLDSCDPYSPPPWLITRGQVTRVLPFGNRVVTLTLDGAELKMMLENGVSSMPLAHGRFPQVSGLCFTYDIAQPPGSRVVDAVRQAVDGSCSGAPIDLSAASVYTLAENDFMAGGGDSYPNFMARSALHGVLDHVVAAWIVATSPISPVVNGRITCTSSGATPCPGIIS